MLELIRQVTLKRHKRKPLAEFAPGDTIEVSVKVKEGEKERIQIYKGVVIKFQGAGISRSFTVRKISDGVGVERTFPFASPSVEKVEVIARGKVRRGKLYYLRHLEGKKARISSEWAQVLVNPVEQAEREHASVAPEAADPADAVREEKAPKAEKKADGKKAETKADKKE
jgi:large subunit ribosomal protein L19